MFHLSAKIDLRVVITSLGRTDSLEKRANYLHFIFVRRIKSIEIVLCRYHRGKSLSRRKASKGKIYTNFIEKE